MRYLELILLYLIPGMILPDAAAREPTIAAQAAH